MSDEQKIHEESLEATSSVVEDDAVVGEAADGRDDALQQAQAEVAEVKEQMLRLQAEMQNVRRRAELDVEKAHKFGLEKFANEMLSVADNLERAIAAAGDDEIIKPLLDGVQMTLDGFLAGLAKFQIEVVNPEGESFNPELHQAMSMVEHPDAAPNSVIAVMQKGYTISGRLLRPAMVMVSKGAAQIDEKA